MNRTYIQAILVLILAATFVAPPLSEMLCSDGCVGGACETPPPATACDLDATGGCCCNAEPAQECALTDPAMPALTDECRMCPCFEDDQIGNFVVPERMGKLKHYQRQRLAITTQRLQDASSEQPIDIFTTGENAHGPPLYQLHHALLI